MPESTDLMGAGVPPLQASLLGNDDLIVTCAGTSQATATLIRTTNVEFSAAGSQTGAILSANLPIGSPTFAITTSSTAAVVYPPTGQTLNGTLNQPFTIAQNKAALLLQYKKGFWSALITA
jgi:hypothetical protein